MKIIIYKYININYNININMNMNMNMNIDMNININIDMDINYLKNYKNIIDTTETLLSLIIYNKKVSSIIKFLEEQLDKAKNISNLMKKHKINNRLFTLNKFIKEVYNEDDIINSIFFVHDKIIEYKLNKQEISTALKYNFLNIYYKTDNIFYIDYFIDLFYNFEFIYAFKINKNELIIKELNKNKESDIIKTTISNESKISEEIDKIRKDYKNIIIIFGNSIFLNKIENMIANKNIILIKEFISRENIFNLYENEIMKKNHILLEKKLNDLKNNKTNIDLYIFGKLKLDIKNAIEEYSIKELYIEDKKLDKLKLIVNESLLNFKIIPIKILENGDIADIFIKNYNGIMAIKYF